MDRAEGMEKRGVVARGWTPPAGCGVRVEPGKTLRECRKTPDGDRPAAELEKDAAKRLADAAEDLLGG